MMNQIGASAPSGDSVDVVGTTSALVMGASDSVVAGYNKDEGVVNLLYSSESRIHNFSGMLVFVLFISPKAAFGIFSDNMKSIFSLQEIIKIISMK